MNHSAKIHEPPVYELDWVWDYDDVTIFFKSDTEVDRPPKACRDHKGWAENHLHALCRFIASMPEPLPAGAQLVTNLSDIGDDIVILDPSTILPANIAGGLISTISMEGSFHG